MIDTSFIQYKLHNNKANYFYSRADMFNQLPWSLQWFYVLKLILFIV